MYIRGMTIRRRVYAIAFASLAACGILGKPPPPEVVKVVPLPKQPPPPPCIAVPDAGVISHAAGEGSRVRFCVGTGADQCFAIDLAMGTLERLRAPPAEATQTAAHVETANPRIDVCTGADCKSLTPKIFAGAAPLHATTNADGSFAVVLLGDAASGKGYAEVWDVVKGKKVATFKYARGEFRCGEVKMAGETIYLAASTCDQPAARAALYTLKGRKIANVGGKDFGVWGNAFAHIDGSTWAFLEENGSLVAIQDAVKGKLIKTVDISPLWSPDGMKNKDSMGNPGESTVVHLGAGKLAVIAGAPAAGRVATVDIATGEVTVTRPPVCK